jgi:hypothetical protein
MLEAPKQITMRSIIPDLLWIGNADDARDVRSVVSLGMRAVIDLADGEPSIQYPREIVYCRLPLNDGLTNDPATVRVAVSSTVEFIKSQVPTLVTCTGGMSRSPAIAAAAVALVERIDPDKALLRVVSAGPHDVSPGLWSRVKKLVFFTERPGQVLFHEYGTQLRLNEQDKLILDVLCGRVGQYGVEFELNEFEREKYKTLGDTFIMDLAKKVQYDPKPYGERGRFC